MEELQREIRRYPAMFRNEIPEGARLGPYTWVKLGSTEHGRWVRRQAADGRQLRYYDDGYYATAEQDDELSRQWVKENSPNFKTWRKKYGKVAASETGEADADRRFSNAADSYRSILAGNAKVNASGSGNSTQGETGASGQGQGAEQGGSAGIENQKGMNNVSNTPLDGKFKSPFDFYRSILAGIVNVNASGSGNSTQGETGASGQWRGRGARRERGQ